MSLKELVMIDDYKIKSVVEDLIGTFLMAGELSIKLRDKGLNKEIKSDNTPVSTVSYTHLTLPTSDLV